MTGLFLTLTLLAHTSATVSETYTPEASAPQKLVFTTMAGAVDVYLPRHIVPGETVSGSAFAAPAGTDWNSQHASYEWLSQLYIRVGENKFRVDNAMLDFQAPANGSQLAMDVEDAVGTVYSSCNLTLADHLEIKEGENKPVVVQAGDTIRIRGHFQGDREHTFASINGHEVGILAEGSDACYITAPMDHRGPILVTVRDAGITVNQKVNIVGFNFMAPAASVPSGKRTSIVVEVDGLKDADPSLFPVVIELHMDNPDVMQFEGPDKGQFLLEINQADVIDGHAIKSVPIRARDGGSYHITGRIFSAG